MAHPAGLEPATIRLEGGCSIQLSYGRLFICSADYKASVSAESHIDLLYRLTQRLAVLDKRGESYRGEPTSSTLNLKKFSEIKGLGENAD